MKEKKASLSVILSGILWGCISLFINPLNAMGLNALNISGVRMLIAAPVFLAAAALSRKLRFKLRDIWIFAAMGIVSVVLFNCLYFYTMIGSSVSVAVVLLYTSPVFVTLMSALFFKEKITGIKIAALVLTVAGCVLITGVLGGEPLPFKMLVTGLLSGFFYALYTIFGRVALSKYHTLTVTAWTFVFALLASIPISGFPKVFALVSVNAKAALLCIGISVVCTVLPYFFYTVGLLGTSPSKAAILVAVEPLCGGLLGVFVFSESAGALKLLGMALIITAIIILNLKPRAVDKK